MDEKKRHLVNGRKLYEQVKGRKDIGIGGQVLTVEILSKTGAQLIGDAAVIKKLFSYRSAEVSHILNWTLGEYGWGEWIICLNFGLLWEYALPVLSKVLSISMFVPGIYYRGEILYRILVYEGDIWERHPDWLLFFRGRLQEMFTRYGEEELKGRLDERMYTELFKLYEEG